MMQGMFTLRTERLDLHPLSMQDADLLRAHWDDPAVRRWMWDGESPSAEQVDQIITASAERFAEGGVGLWSLRSEGWLIGVAGLQPVTGHPEHTELLTSIQPAWWGQGLATEAAVEVLRSGFASGIEHVVVGETDKLHTRGRSFVVGLGFSGVLELTQPLGQVRYWGLTPERFAHFHPLRWHWKSFGALDTRALYDLLALRQEVFVVEQECAYLDADGKDPQAMHLLGYDGDRLAVYLRAFAPGVLRREAVIGRVVTAQDSRGVGWGRRLMEEGIRRVWRHWGQGPIFLSAQSHLEDWYRALGFEICGPGYLEDGIPHLPMCNSGEVSEVIADPPSDLA